MKSINIGLIESKKAINRKEIPENENPEKIVIGLNKKTKR